MKEIEQKLNQIASQNLERVKDAAYEVLTESQIIVRMIAWELSSKEFPNEVVKSANRFLTSLMDYTHNLPFALIEVEKSTNEHDHEHAIKTICSELSGFFLLRGHIEKLKWVKLEGKVINIINHIEKELLN
ncbi:hypothetical protein ACFWMS_23635 [Peribacillus butanolivorans]|uniref:hypothetical protein n=1 Tax=Peribacillus butanolivorans TaxID=421767 RepID=UPI0036490982